MANFNWYLNKQGIRGPQGEKGADGGTPTVTEAENTSDSYKLLITNADGVNITTPNLRGSFTIEDQGGKYVIYNSDTSKLIARDPYEATTTEIGAVRFVSDDDITSMNLGILAALTPSTAVNLIPVTLYSPDGSIEIAQDTETKRTQLSVKFDSEIKIGNTILTEAQLIKLLDLIK